MAIIARENLIAAWAFTAGTIIAILVGIFVQSDINPIILIVLTVLGLIVGYFVAQKDVKTFLMASVSLVLVSYAGIAGLAKSAIVGINITEIMRGVLGSLMAMFIPATIIVVIKTVFSISKS